MAVFTILDTDYLTHNPSSKSVKLTKNQANTVRWIIRPKLKLFYFHITTNYPSDVNYLTDNASETDNRFLVRKKPIQEEMPHQETPHTVAAYVKWNLH